MSAAIRRIVCSCGWTGAVAAAPIILCPRCGGTDWRRETNAETLRRLRADAANRGKCFTCRYREVRPGTRYCEECIQRAAAYKESIAYRKCQQCGVDVSKRGTLECAECTSKSSAWHRRRADARVANGQCARCGALPVKPGHRTCVPCLDEGKDSQIMKNRIAGQEPRDACTTCTALGLSGVGHNRRTHDRWMERRKAWAP